MLDLLGTIGANALSLPGILGVAAGMTTRRLPLAVLLGALVGLVETLLFAGFRFGNIDATEFVVALAVGAMAGVVGWVLRVNGATV